MDGAMAFSRGSERCKWGLWEVMCDEKGGLGGGNALGDVIGRDK